MKTYKSLSPKMQAVLASHKQWLADPSQGKQADLRGADLQDANLQYSDLLGANLQGANLQGAKR